MSANARDDARAVLSRPDAPESERFDAESELQKAYRPLASQLIPREDLNPIIAMIRGDLAEHGDMLKAQAASRANVVDHPGRWRAAPDHGPKAVLLDEFGAQVTGDFYEKPGALSFDMLRAMVAGMPILSSIVLLRMRQVQRFCNPSEDGGIGFEIRHRDKDHRPSAEEKKRMADLGRYFTNCGWEWDARKRKRLKRDNFPQFAAKLVRDTLTMDSAPIECELTRDRKKVDGFYALDGSTIRLCTEDGWEGNEDIYALQLVQGRVAATFDHEELIYEVRNGATAVTNYGYGMGEPELLAKVVTAFINGMSYNADVFDKNSIPKGLLQIVGEYSQEDMAAFRRHWNAQVRGIENRHALPVLVAKDGDGKATYTPFQNEQDEMAYAKWMVFLTSIACAIYGCDPEEISFESFSANRSSLRGDNTQEKIGSSRDKGLRPLMSWMEGCLTDFVVTCEEPDFVFRFNGLDEDDADKAWEAKKLTLTVNELRAEQGYEPHPVPAIGDAPLNPALIEPWLQLAHPNLLNPDFGGQAPEPQDAPPPPEMGDEFGGEAPEITPAKPEAPGDEFGGEEPERPELPQPEGMDQGTEFGAEASQPAAPAGPAPVKGPAGPSKPEGSDRPRKS
jgi:hypothetical protein